MFFNIHSLLPVRIALAGTLISGLLGLPGIAWNTFVGGSTTDNAAAIAVESNGNSYVVGHSNSNWGAPLHANSGDYDAFVAKINTNGGRVWHTFLGGTNMDFGEDIALDGSGNIYITGTSRETWGTPLLPFGGFYDAFVAKFNSQGELQWSTFLGGEGDDQGHSIAVDGSDNVYVTGLSGGGWGTPLNPPSGGGSDVFVAKLNSAGVLQWNTFWGAYNQLDDSYAIVTTSSGESFITGESDGTWGTPVTPHQGCCYSDVFVAKFNTAGALQWNTFMGGANDERGEGIGIDGNGNIFVTGFTWWGWGTPLNPYGGGLIDAFAAKFNGAGGKLWHTFLGGAEGEVGRDIAVSSNGNVYVTGYSESTWGTPQNPFGGYEDAFVAKLNGDGNRLWNTFLGGTGADEGYGIALSSGKYYVTGFSSKAWGSPVAPMIGGTDTFATKSDLEPSSFADVPTSHPYYQDIEILYANGLTGGCATAPLKFCPDQIMNRGQAAVFMLRANFGSSYVPPVPTHIFQDDWSKGTWAEPWAEGMRKEGLSAGCLAKPLKYCPWDQIPREQAVIFALRMKYGTLYTPPPATGTMFADMTNPSYYATSWAEQAYTDGLIPNCGMSGGKPKFCPKNLVSRGLAAYMIVRAKNLTMPGSP